MNQKPNDSRKKPAGDSGPKRNISRGAALRAQKRSVQDANRIASQYQSAEAGADRQPASKRRANVIDDRPRLKIIGLGGMDGGGSKNMMVIEYQNDAIVIDCGNDLGVDLPGINYGIADSTCSSISISNFTRCSRRWASTS